MISFENLSALNLFLAIAFLAVLYSFSWKSKKKILKLFGIPQKGVKKSQMKRFILSSLLVGSIILAMTIPKIQKPVEIYENTGEVALMVDVSRSMAAKKQLDEPSRIERTKEILRTIIVSFPSAKFSLYGFKNTAVEHVPFVGEEGHSYLLQTIQYVLDINSVPGEWTVFGPSLLDVSRKFSDGAKVKLILLFSDGEQALPLYYSSGEATAALAESTFILKSKGIKVTTIGVGEKEGATIPIYDKKGGFTGKYATYRREIYVTYLNEELLRKIALETEGRYFYEAELEGLIRYIGTELSRGEVIKKTVYAEDISVFFLIPVIALWIVFVRFYFK